MINGTRLNRPLTIYFFTSRSRIFLLYGDVTITGEGLQNLGQCSALRAFEQGGIFIVPHLLWHGTSVFPVSSEVLPHSVASYDTGMWRIYSNPDPHGFLTVQIGGWSTMMYDLLTANINSCLETFYSMKFQSDNLGKETRELEMWKQRYTGRAKRL
jgi:hypothetical protein